MTGLRERKKQQTRRAIHDSALRLFAAHGFDQVPVSRIAREADVSEATVFNYFPTKEDLVYDGMDAFEAELVGRVRDRPGGESLLAAFRAGLLQAHGLAGDRETVRQIAKVARIVSDSPALQARERQVFDRYTRHLADLIATETSAARDDVEPWVTANALLGINRALKQLVHDMALAGHDGAEIAEAALAQGGRAFESLERGLPAATRRRR
jgi:AcrR family transcriptional regulator